MSDQQKLSRQELYQQIRNTSKDEVILTEMIRLGFWQANQEKPSLAESFIKKRNELHSQLSHLGRELALYENPELALKELHKQRKKLALEKREQTKQERNLKRYQRAQAWFEKNQKYICYLGENVSQGLIHYVGNNERLISQSLPVLEDSAQLAAAMGISVSELRFLSFKRSVSKVSHYQHFQLPKKTGGVRDIAAPMPRLKRAQYWLLENILMQVPVSERAHGFVKERSIVSNAVAHVKKDIVINIDLEDFFPSVSFSRVKGVFLHLGYSEHLATIFSALCTESDKDIVCLDGERFYVDKSSACLPQGAPTSPAITNILCRKLDRRMSDVSRSLGFDYSRYADDLTFSGNNIDDSKIKKLFWRIKAVLKDENFKLNHAKTRIMRKHRKQEVTGVVVNEKLSADRKTLRKFRALLHQMDHQGIEGKSWGSGELFASITGYANFVTMLDAPKGLKLQKQVVHLKRKYQQPVKPWKITSLNSKLFRAKAAAGQAPRDNWWQALEKEPAVLELTAKQLSDQKQQAQRTRLKLEKDARATQEVASEPQSPTLTDADAIDKPKKKSKAKIVFYIVWAICVYFYWRSKN